MRHQRNSDNKKTPLKKPYISKLWKSPAQEQLMRSTGRDSDMTCGIAPHASVLQGDTTGLTANVLMRELCSTEVGSPFSSNLCSASFSLPVALFSAPRPPRKSSYIHCPWLTDRPISCCTITTPPTSCSYPPLGWQILLLTFEGRLNRHTKN